MKVLAGDIGGTKTWLRVAECNTGHCQLLYEQRFPSQAYNDFSCLIGEFLSKLSGETGKGLASACLAIAGPVETAADYQQAVVTNLPWKLENRALAAQFKFPIVELINDFSAIALSLDTLPGGDLLVVQAGTPQVHGPRVILGAGTGLGACQMLWAGDDHPHIVPSEGGHADFAPTSTEQLELLAYLMKRYEQVSCEHVLSGPGLANIYSFLRDTMPGNGSIEAENPLTGEDPAALISQSALAGDDPLARKALDIFIAAYGAQAGNFALLNLALGGVYIAGGIATHLSNELASKTFLRAFHNKGRMSGLMSRIPVYIILNAKAGLLGATLRASALAN